MKFLTDNWVLIALVLSSGAMLLWPILLQTPQTGALTANQVVRLINREKAVVVDVCDAAEFAAGHVVGAKNIPLSQLEAKLTVAVKNKALPLVFVCQAGRRAPRAVMLAKKLGFANAQSLGGGLQAWKQANLPLEKSTSTAISKA